MRKCADQFHLNNLCFDRPLNLLFCAYCKTLIEYQFSTFTCAPLDHTPGGPCFDFRHTLSILAQELMSSYFTKPKDWSFNNWCPLICFQGAQSRRNSQIHLLISWSEFCHLWNNVSSFKKDHVYYIWLANANISYNYVEYLVWYMIAKGIILLIANIK